MNTCLNAAFRKLLGAALLLFLTSGLEAQTAILISSAMARAERIRMELSLDSSSGVSPAALQWTMHYPSTIRSITILDAPALTEAGKTVVCSGVASPITCIAVGLNDQPIPDRVVAMVNVLLNENADSATIDITDALGVSAAGYPIPVGAIKGTVSRGTRNGVRFPFRQRVPR